MSANQNYQKILDEAFDKRFALAKVRAALQGGLDQGVSYGTSIVKVRSGQLKSGLGSEIVSDTEGKLVSKAPHSGYVNDGTYKMSGDQFFDKMAVVAEKAIKENLSKL